ncbi:MAG: putative lipoprotein [Deltaproteobacteria bacterium]|nr:putative lipoprotein [Deltaproteobacteria bacterium]
MRLAAVIAAVIAGSACRGTPPRLSPVAGGDKDDGHGELAKASTRFMTAEESDDDLFASSGRGALHKHERASGDDAYGGSPYGGSGYASFIVPTWSYPSVNRTPKYNQVVGLSGAIEGVVSWRGSVPAPRATGCGPIESLRMAADRGVADVLVYIEHVEIGRPLPNEGLPASVGGLVIKRGCALVPTLQIVTPLPAALSIHGDAHQARIVVTNAPSAPKLLELQEAGRASLEVAAGVTRIDAADGSLAPAWVVALDTPYYAVTDDHGHFRIDELAPGSYEVTIWQAPLPSGGTGAIKYGAPTIAHRSIKVDAMKAARLDIALGR